MVAADRTRVDAERAPARTEIEQRLRALAPTPQDFSGPALEARLSLKQAADQLAQDWANAADASRSTCDNLDPFKRENNLHRPGIYPRSTLMQAGLLLCAALFEAMFSAALFAEDDERGLLGGAITATGLLGANVTLGFLGGFLGLRYLQHARGPGKTMGAVAFAFFFFGADAQSLRVELARSHRARQRAGAKPFRRGRCELSHREPAAIARALVQDAQRQSAARNRSRQFLALRA